MTDNKNPMPPSSSSGDPNAHGIYDSPAYTAAGDAPPTLGTQPVQMPPAGTAAGSGGGGGGAAAPVSAADEFANINFDVMEEGTWVVGTGDPKKDLHIKTFTQRTSTGTPFLLEATMFWCGMTGKASDKAASTQISNIRQKSPFLQKVC